MWTLQETASNLNFEHCPSGLQERLVPANGKTERGLGESEGWTVGRETVSWISAIRQPTISWV